MPSSLYILLNRHHLSHHLLPLPMDASKRRYYRVESSTDHPIPPLVMESPQSEKPEQFKKIASYLNELGLRAPKILDEEGDFYLIEDFGTQTYRAILTDASLPHATSTHTTSMSLYTLAVDVLSHLVKHAVHHPPFVPMYTTQLFQDEILLFSKWFLNKESHEPDIKIFQEIWDNLLKHLIDVPHTFILRDFHIDNLFYLSQDTSFSSAPPVSMCGLIDFQDGLWGPVGYDLVSLTGDARIDVQTNLREHLTAQYLSLFPSSLHQKLLTAFKIMDMHRQMRIVGVFSRLEKRDFKTTYKRYLPRVWSYIHTHLKDPLFKDLKNWLDHYDIPQYDIS